MVCLCTKIFLKYFPIKKCFWLHKMKYASDMLGKQFYNQGNYESNQ